MGDASNYSNKHNNTDSSDDRRERSDGSWAVRIVAILFALLFIFMYWDRYSVVLRGDGHLDGFMSYIFVTLASVPAVVSLMISPLVILYIWGHLIFRGSPPNFILTKDGESVIVVLLITSVIAIMLGYQQFHEGDAFFKMTR